MNMRKCMDCGVDNKNVVNTGSLICEKCQDEQFQLIQEKYGTRKRRIVVKKNNPTEEVKRLLKETNLSLTEIAEQTGRSYQTVWSHSQKIRGGQKETQPKVEEESEKASSKVVAVEKYEELKENIRGILVENEELKEKLNQRTEDKELLEKYQLEKQKHEALLRYLSLFKS